MCRMVSRMTFARGLSAARSLALPAMRDMRDSVSHGVSDVSRLALSCERELDIVQAGRPKGAVGQINDVNERTRVERGLFLFCTILRFSH